MTIFVHELINHSVLNEPNKDALLFKSQKLSYLELQEQIDIIAASYRNIGVSRNDRIGLYLHKTIETVTSIFACSKAEAVFVPINPVLKAAQVEHIVNDCEIRVIITNKSRFRTLENSLCNLPSLTHIILIDALETDREHFNSIDVLPWDAFTTKNNKLDTELSITGNDIAAILYTSGSTGKPKGVVLSHSNIVLGAQSVAQYLNNTREDVILAVLPLSFDYGLSQITTSFTVGASCVLLDYLLPRDVIKAIDKFGVTGLAAVPPLWSQLCKLDWSKKVGRGIRYFTNSGGALSQTNLSQLRELMPNADPFLMYGLTEAFRSTYLPPNEIDKRKGSMGKAIPNAEVLVVRKDGTECAPNEVGELVHKGPLVSLGYWNDLDKTKQRFKPAPHKPNGVILEEIAVWSGDSVTKDRDGYLYFVARQDEMIKTSGYRVSPMEIEEVLYQHEFVTETAVIGVPHDEFGQAVLAIVCTQSIEELTLIEKNILQHCQKVLANYMVPRKVIVLSELPHNANGKIDRSLLNQTYKDFFGG